jgi:hypothetical protein
MRTHAARYILLKASAQLHNTCALIFRKQCTPPLLFPLPLEPGILKLLLIFDLEIRFGVYLIKCNYFIDYEDFLKVSVLDDQNLDQNLHFLFSPRQIVTTSTWLIVTNPCYTVCRSCGQGEYLSL